MLSESCSAFKDGEDGARGGRKGRRREHVAGAADWEPGEGWVPARKAENGNSCSRWHSEHRIGTVWSVTWAQWRRPFLISGVYPGCGGGRDRQPPHHLICILMLDPVDSGVEAA